MLNAKYHELEAEIVADAGVHGAVTIATNMAGRGTDIKLDDEAKEAGGLKIIGTERHESRRIDNQLRGRSGRQGDPGESRFYISLEDDLMRLFGSERLMDVFNTLGVEDGEQIEHKMLSNAIEKAQKKIENNNFGIRKNLLEYDQVMNEQREIIYEERRQVLDGENMRDPIYHMITDYVENTVDRCVSADQDSEEWDLTELEVSLKNTIPSAGAADQRGYKRNAAERVEASAEGTCGQGLRGKRGRIPGTRTSAGIGASGSLKSYRCKMDGSHRRYGSAPSGNRTPGLWPERSAGRIQDAWI